MNSNLIARNLEFSATPRDICRVLFRHKAKSLTFFGLTMGLVTLGVILWPRTYKSEAKLLVRIGRESVALDPTAATGDTLAISRTEETEMLSVLEILKSRTVAERVVDRLGTAAITGEPTVTSRRAASLNPLSSLVAAFNNLDPVSQREATIQALQQTIMITCPKESRVVSVQYTADSPALAQKITSAWLDVSMDEHMRLSRTQGSYGFFAKQEALVRQQLESASLALRDAKNASGLLSVAGQRSILEGQISEVERRQLVAEAALSASEAKIASLRRAIALLPPMVVTQQVSGFGHGATDGMRQVLYNLQVSEQELRSKFTDDHPSVRATRSQLAAAQEILRDQPADRQQTTTGMNQARQSASLDLLNEEALATALLAETKAIDRQLVGLQGKLRSLNDHEVHIAQLERRVGLLDAKYQAYSDHLEEARIDEALQAQRISSMNVLQPASLIERPVSPRKGFVLAFGMLVATVGGLGVARFAELLDPTLKTSKEVETKLDLPVLFSIPRTSQVLAEIPQDRSSDSRKAQDRETHGTWQTGKA